jgi:tetratricopeptide (TPR) repeat protein
LANNQRGIAFSKGCISMCYIMEGKITHAYEYAQEALTLAKETGDASIKGMAYPFYITSCYSKGLFEDAKTHFLEYTSSYEKSASISSTGWTYSSIGGMHIDLGEYNDAVDCYEKIIPIMKSDNYMPSMINYFQSCLIRAKALRNDQDIELNELFACYENYKLTWCKGWTARNIGDVLLHIDNDHLADAEVWFQKAIKEDTKNGCRWSLAMDLAFYADWFKKKDDRAGVKEQLTKAIDIFRECGADGWLEKSEKELALL